MSVSSGRDPAKIARLSPNDSDSDTATSPSSSTIADANADANANAKCHHFSQYLHHDPPRLSFKDVVSRQVRRERRQQDQHNALHDPSLVEDVWQVQHTNSNDEVDRQHRDAESTEWLVFLATVGISINVTVTGIRIEAVQLIRLGFGIGVGVVVEQVFLH